MKSAEYKSLYPPEETPVLKYYSSFDNVFVGLKPFVKLEKENIDPKSSQKVISPEEAREEADIFREIEAFANLAIYSTNENYPSDEEIAMKGTLTKWKEVIASTKIENFKEVNKALMTSIGAYKKQLRRSDLLEILNQYAEKNSIWHPTAGMFDYFTKVMIYEILKSANVHEVVVEDVYQENKKLIELMNLTKKEFCKAIDHTDYFIYAKDNSLLFSTSWDNFFFFIALNEKVFSKQIVEKYFEGFWADENDSHLWTWEKGEIDQLLNSSNEKSKVKYWWQKCLNSITGKVKN